MKNIQNIYEHIICGKEIGFEEAKAVLNSDIYDVLYFANKLREHYKGRKIAFCGIINAKSGLCSEDCKYCAQSSFHNAGVLEYPLVSEEKILEGFERVKKSFASCYGIVTSGLKPEENEIKTISNAVSRIKDKGLRISASLGSISYDTLKYLKDNGVKRFHHNLETARSFFPNICSTHSYDDKIETILSAKKAGLEVCSGGIIGLGESSVQRIELAFELKKLDVDSIPINVLNPIKGTSLENQKILKPEDVLRAIAIFRFINPKKDIGLCGGREVSLGGLQSWIFYAGANTMMVGGYLTTKGRAAEDDIKMAEDLGFEY